MTMFKIIIDISLVVHRSYIRINPLVLKELAVPAEILGLSTAWMKHLVPLEKKKDKASSSELWCTR